MGECASSRRQKQEQQKEDIPMSIRQASNCYFIYRLFVIQPLASYIAVQLYSDIDIL